MAATIAFARVPALTRWAAGHPGRVLAARASVFHEAFLIGAGLAVLGLLIAVTWPAAGPSRPGPGLAGQAPSHGGRPARGRPARMRKSALISGLGGSGTG